MNTYLHIFIHRMRHTQIKKNKNKKKPSISHCANTWGCNNTQTHEIASSPCQTQTQLIQCLTFSIPKLGIGLEVTKAITILCKCMWFYTVYCKTSDSIKYMYIPDSLVLSLMLRIPCPSCRNSGLCAEGGAYGGWQSRGQSPPSERKENMHEIYKRDIQASIEFLTVLFLRIK